MTEASLRVSSVLQNYYSAVSLPARGVKPYSPGVTVSPPFSALGFTKAEEPRAEEPSVEKFAGDIDDFLIVDNFGTKDERYGKKLYDKMRWRP